jgi:hypothetical protein
MSIKFRERLLLAGVVFIFLAIMLSLGFFYE